MLQRRERWWAGWPVPLLPAWPAGHRACQQSRSSFPLAQHQPGLPGHHNPSQALATSAPGIVRTRGKHWSPQPLILDNLFLLAGRDRGPQPCTDTTLFPSPVPVFWALSPPSTGGWKVSKLLPSTLLIPYSQPSCLSIPGVCSATPSYDSVLPGTSNWTPAPTTLTPSTRSPGRWDLSCPGAALGEG